MAKGRKACSAVGKCYRRPTETTALQNVSSVSKGNGKGGK